MRGDAPGQIGWTTEFISLQSHTCQVSCLHHLLYFKASKQDASIQPHLGPSRKRLKRVRGTHVDQLTLVQNKPEEAT